MTDEGNARFTLPHSFLSPHRESVQLCWRFRASRRFEKGGSLRCARSSAAFPRSLCSLSPRLLAAQSPAHVLRGLSALVNPNTAAATYSAQVQATVAALHCWPRSDRCGQLRCIDIRGSVKLI